MSSPVSPAPSAVRRQLGRSRYYTRDDLPPRLLHWHAPRANRWELLCLLDGALCVQWLLPEGIRTDTMQADDRRWIAPGTRWRVLCVGKGTSFALEIHADDATPVSTPQASRADWLTRATTVRVDDESSLANLLLDLPAGAQRLLRGHFDLSAVHLNAMLAACDEELYWHPLSREPAGFVAFAARAGKPVRLLEYLGRDHAVIEATLDGTFCGDAEHVSWLRGSLERHMSIEENVLFPAYLAAGGHAGWVRGLCNEHNLLRRQVAEASNAAGDRRRLILLLDGHDEKEEQIVYPDLMARVGDAADALVRAAMLYPVPLVAG